MNERDQVTQNAQTRLVEIFTRKPASAFSKIKGLASIREGVACTYVQGEHTVIADMSDIFGGDDTGPSPGFYARAGIASCVAISIKLAATQAGLTFRAVDVEISVSFDGRGIFYLDEIGAGPQDMSVNITIETDAPKGAVEKLVARAMDASPIYLLARDGNAIATSVSIAPRA